MGFKSALSEEKKLRAAWNIKIGKKLCHCCKIVELFSLWIKAVHKFLGNFFIFRTTYFPFEQFFAFWTISGPTISEDCPSVVRRPYERFRTFRTFPKINEVCQRHPKIFQLSVHSALKHYYKLVSKHDVIDIFTIYFSKWKSPCKLTIFWPWNVT